jgi:hypothetical protein
MQLQINCIEWVLEKIEVNKILNDRLDGHIRTMIKNLEIRKDIAMIRVMCFNLADVIALLYGLDTTTSSFLSSDNFYNYLVIRISPLFDNICILNSVFN